MTAKVERVVARPRNGGALHILDVGTYDRYNLPAPPALCGASPLSGWVYSADASRNDCDTCMKIARSEREQHLQHPVTTSASSPRVVVEATSEQDRKVTGVSVVDQ